MTRLSLLAAVAILSPLPAMADETPGAHFIENWDLNFDGVVSAAEIVERRGDIFYMFDQDEDGILSQKEYVLFDETRAADMKNNASSHGKGAGRMQVGLTLAFNDTNGNGEVSKEEFIEQSMPWLVEVDRNNDNEITLADFGPR